MENIQCWNDAKDCTIWNRKDIMESVEIRRDHSVTLWSFVMTRLTEKMTAVATVRT